MNKDIIISIHPRHVEQITSLKKGWEYRKKIWNTFSSQHLFSEFKYKIFIYATHPKQEIIGYFSPEVILCCSPKELWSLTSDKAGITEKEFYQYFDKASVGYALEITNLTIYRTPIPVTIIRQLLPHFVGPQSFLYPKGSLQNFLERYTGVQELHLQEKN